MIEQDDDVTSVEHHVRVLTETALEAARERAACEATVERARETLERSQRELPQAERFAKEQRQAQNDAIRGRAELEHRLAELVESEDLTRQRRLQAEQRAQGFRAAAAFAAAGRAEADGGGDADRVDRERMVEERATREASTAEARAAEELAEETKLARLRSEIETHVEAERALESEIAADRANAEAQVAALREAIERASFELHEAEVNLARLDADRDRLTQERTAAGERLREIGMRARTEIEARIAELRAQENAIAAAREEQERLLAALVENDRAVEAEAETEAQAQAQAPATAVAAQHNDDATAVEPSAAAAAVEPAPPPEPHFSTMSFTTGLQPREAPAPERQPAAEAGEAADDRSVRSLIGNSLIGSIFTRRKPVEEPVEDEGPSISERIARDFGLLGGDENDAPAAAFDAEHVTEPAQPQVAAIPEAVHTAPVQPALPHMVATPDDAAR